MSAIIQAAVRANRQVNLAAVRRPIRATVLVGTLAMLLGLAGGPVASVPSQAFASATVPGTAIAASANSSPAARAGAYGRLPLAFEPNRGQFDARVGYAMRGAGYALFLTRQAATLSFAATARGHHRNRAAAVSIGLIGASPHASLAATQKLPGTANYLIGRGPSHWHVNIPTYGRVWDRGVWPGISAAFYGKQGRLEYDFDVSPGADPSRIALSFAGARSVRAERDGALWIALRGGGGVRQLAPHAYQRVDGRVRIISSRYVLSGKRVRVRVGHYDHRLPLVIDPVLVYSAFLGDGQGLAIAVDSSGAAYVTGSTNSATFPTTIGAAQTSSGGTYDAFVTKVAADGASVLYSTYLGGSGNDGGNGIAVDSSGAAYVTGSTASANFPTTSGAFQITHPGGFDAFVTKLAANGTSLVYSTLLGGASNDYGNGIAVDSSGAAYVTGQSFSTDFPTTVGAFQITHPGGADAFATKLVANGTGLVYSTYLGGSGTDEALGIGLDSSGAAYVTGDTTSTDFPTTVGAFQTSNAGSADGFVTKLAANGASLSYSTYFGGSGGESVRGIAVDSSGAAYVTGYTFSTDFPTTASAFQTSAGGGTIDAFVTKVAANGASLSYSTYLGGSGGDYGFGIAVDSAGAAHVTGYTDSTDFPTTTGAIQTSNDGGGGDTFMTKVAVNGASLSYSTYFGGSGFDQGFGIAVDSAGAAYFTGSTTSTDFPTTSGAYRTAFAGVSTDGFVTKLALGGGSPPAQHTLTVSKAGAGSGMVTSSPAGISCGASCSAAYDDGTQVTLSAASSAGSSFAGWSGGGCTGTGTCMVTVTSATAVTATFNANATSNPNAPAQQTLTVSKAGAGSGMVTSSPAGISCGASCSAAYDDGTQVTLSAASSAGSSFAGWSGGGCTGTGTCIVTVTSDTTITATFNASTTFATTGGGTAAPERAGSRLHAGVQVSPAQRGCKVETQHRGPASSSSNGGCTLARLVLAGTIDRRADGQALVVRLTAKLGRRHVLVVAHPRIAGGRLRLVIRLPARDRDPGDRWTFTIAYAGNKLLLPATVHGGFWLETESTNNPPNEIAGFRRGTF
jgi:hypothetical protein